MVALPFVGGATLFISCEDKSVTPKTQEEIEATMTQQSDSLRLVNTENGKLTYIFTTPLMERYELAKEPYMEFRKGIEIETYGDSTQVVESTLIANYAIFLENKKLWEAKGNVVCTNARGQKLETEQLFWNQRTRKIYSNVDSKLTQPGGDVVVGVGFESDERFMEWEFRKPKGKVLVDVKPTDEQAQSDSLATTNTTPVATNTIQPAPKSKPQVKLSDADVKAMPTPVLEPRIKGDRKPMPRRATRPVADKRQ